MAATSNERLEDFMAGLVRRNPGQPEFHQAVREVAETLIPFILAHPEYQDAAILERLTEPDRIITFPRHLERRCRARARQPCVARAVQQRHRARTRAACASTRP